MTISRVTDPKILAAGGGYVLTAENDQDNAVINVLVEMMQTLYVDDVIDEDLVNSHGCVRDVENARNYVTIPNDEFAMVISVTFDSDEVTP